MPGLLPLIEKRDGDGRGPSPRPNYHLVRMNQPIRRSPGASEADIRRRIEHVCFVRNRERAAAISVEPPNRALL
jgi:hypothetical protein